MERVKQGLRWIALGLVVAWLVRSGTGGCDSSLPAPGTEAQAFEVPAADAFGAGTYRLDAYRGQPVVLVFFATWCGACRRELPEVQRMVERQPDLKVLLLSEEEPRALAAWLSRQQMRLPAGGGAGGTLRAYGVRVLPSAVLVGEDGRVRYSGQGTSGVARALREALRAKERGAAGLRREDGVLGTSEGGKKSVPRSTCHGTPLLC